VGLKHVTIQIRTPDFCEKLSQSVHNMGTRKHNEFLETGASDDEISSQGYDSGADDIRKGGRSPKRRKLESDGSDDEDAV
jgi:hypothetical protein